MRDAPSRSLDDLATMPTEALAALDLRGDHAVDHARHETLRSALGAALEAAFRARLEAGRAASRHGASEGHGLGKKTPKRRLPVLCPSATMRPGALLLGVVREDGRVALAARARVIDMDFVMVALRGRNPRRRFRFGDVCEADVCPYWRTGRCGVADAVVATAREDATRSPPACVIRAQCRWFEQSGKTACGACAEVITGLLESEYP